MRKVFFRLLQGGHSDHLIIVATDSLSIFVSCSHGAFSALRRTTGGATLRSAINSSIIQVVRFAGRFGMSA